MNDTTQSEQLRSGRLFDLARRWSKDADQYQRQVEEARSKGLPHDQMLSMMTALRQCSKELGTELGRSNTQGQGRRASDAASTADDSRRSL